jgi:hypothetical protein
MFDVFNPIKRIAEIRERLHKNHASSRQLTEQTNAVGLVGEFRFGEEFGVYPDTSVRPSGDNGIDFIMPLTFSIDVKTRNYHPKWEPFYLLIEEGTINADIYVLALIHPDGDKCKLAGWIWGEDACRYPVDDLGTGVRNHQVPVADLRPMDELKNRRVKF